MNRRHENRSMKVWMWMAVVLMVMLARSIGAQAEPPLLPHGGIATAQAGSEVGLRVGVQAASASEATATSPPGASQPTAALR
ncbi:hypothetical protein BH09PSE5_BH09PSE5_27070 [soil metagenome]